MSDFDKKVLENLEKLCRIKCTQEEEEKLLNSLSRILDYVEQLSEVDTENVPPCNYVLKDMQKNVFRKDEVKTTLSRDAFLSNSPKHIGGMIKVPPVLTTSDMSI